MVKVTSVAKQGHGSKGRGINQEFFDCSRLATPEDGKDWRVPTRMLCRMPLRCIAWYQIRFAVCTVAKCEPVSQQVFNPKVEEKYTQLPTTPSAILQEQEVEACHHFIA